LLRGKDVQELKELQRQGMSIQAISGLTGWDRKTIRKYVQAAGVVPEYGPRPARPSKLDAFKPYLQERLSAGVWNARVLLRELRERNFTGSYTILTDWLRPQRSTARVVAVRRFETAPGKQAQVDWGHLGTLEMGEQGQKLHGFTFTLDYSRRMVAEVALDQKLGTLLRLHEAAFQQIGGVRYIALPRKREGLQHKLPDTRDCISIFRHAFPQIQLSRSPCINSICEQLSSASRPKHIAGTASRAQNPSFRSSLLRGSLLSSGRLIIATPRARSTAVSFRSKSFITSSSDT